MMRKKTNTSLRSPKARKKDRTRLNRMRGLHPKRALEGRMQKASEDSRQRRGRQRGGYSLGEVDPAIQENEDNTG